jgi:predicted ester cyclase
MSTVENNKALFHRWFGEVWNKGNYEVAHEVIGSTMRVHGAGGQPVEMGPDGLIGLVETWRNAFPNGQMSIDGLVAERDLVVALLTWRGTHQGEFYGIPATGKSVVCTSIGIDRMEDGKVVDGWGELDMVGLMQQLGALPLVGPGATAAGKAAEWGGTVASGDGASSLEANKDLMRRYIEAVNQGSYPDDLIDAARYIEHNPVWGASDLESSRGVYAMLRAALPDLRFEPDPELTIAEGDKAAAHAVVTGTHTGAELFGVAPTGKQLTWTHSEVARVEDGKIVERWVSADMLTLMQQVGAIPAPDGS